MTGGMRRRKVNLLQHDGEREEQLCHPMSDKVDKDEVEMWREKERSKVVSPWPDWRLGWSSLRGRAGSGLPAWKPG